MYNSGITSSLLVKGDTLNIKHDVKVNLIVYKYSHMISALVT